MNESWRRAEADAHEAKADALGIAVAALRGCEGALSSLAWNQAASLLVSLEHERDAHAQAATLVRANDQAARRKGVRRGRERGCWLYVPAAQLVEVGYPLDQPPPFYRTWPGRKRTLLVQLYEER